MDVLQLIGAMAVFGVVGYVGFAGTMLVWFATVRRKGGLESIPEAIMVALLAALGAVTLVASLLF